MSSHIWKYNVSVVTGDRMQSSAFIQTPDRDLGFDMSCYNAVKSLMVVLLF